MAELCRRRIFNVAESDEKFAKVEAKVFSLLLEN